ncbi:MAG: hypothetical protein M3220_03695 [Chloroflexota bacterium]|nr:hypothetical protein [Chloroflexota bacterium]
MNQQPQSNNLYAFLFGGERSSDTIHPLSGVLAARNKLLALDLSANAAFFLALVLAWWFHYSRRPFYQFNRPCDHDKYREGESWLEQLRVGIYDLFFFIDSVTT